MQATHGGLAEKPFAASAGSFRQLPQSIVRACASRTIARSRVEASLPIPPIVVVMVVVMMMVVIPPRPHPGPTVPNIPVMPEPPPVMMMMVVVMMVMVVVIITVSPIFPILRLLECGTGVSRHRIVGLQPLHGVWHRFQQICIGSGGWNRFGKRGHRTCARDDSRGRRTDKHCGFAFHDTFLRTLRFPVEGQAIGAFGPASRVLLRDLLDTKPRRPPG